MAEHEGSTGFFTLAPEETPAPLAIPIAKAFAITALRSLETLVVTSPVTVVNQAGTIEAIQRLEIAVERMRQGLVLTEMAEDVEPEAVT